MKKLIEALQIFVKYKDESCPTHCEHDILMIAGITQDEVSEEDKKKLDELGFFWSNENDCWASFRYGSA
jgi:hypothetical protein